MMLMMSGEVKCRELKRPEGSWIGKGRKSFSAVRLTFLLSL